MMQESGSADAFRDRLLSLGLARVSEAAALAAAAHVGRGDEHSADQAAVNAMRSQLNLLDINGTVVIGEGERDIAPMLFIGEQVGSGSGYEVDIALDPLEGTALTAKGLPNALTVIAMGPRGTILHAPDVYMDKLAIGPGYEEGLLSLDMQPSERIHRLAAARQCRPDEISACILDRPRHADMIDEVRSTGAAIRLITDGDVAGIMSCADPVVSGIDICMGIGGAPEGVLAAAALRCMGGQIEGRLMFRNDDERARARAAGIEDLDRVYRLRDMIRRDVIFAATGVTDGAILRGIRVSGGYVETQTLLLRSKTGSMRRVTYRCSARDHIPDHRIANG